MGNLKSFLKTAGVIVVLAGCQARTVAPPDRGFSQPQPQQQLLLQRTNVPQQVYIPESPAATVPRQPAGVPGGAPIGVSTSSQSVSPAANLSNRFAVPPSALSSAVPPVSSSPVNAPAGDPVNSLPLSVNAGGWQPLQTQSSRPSIAPQPLNVQPVTVPAVSDVRVPVSFAGQTPIIPQPLVTSETGFDPQELNGFAPRTSINPGFARPAPDIVGDLLPPNGQPLIIESEALPAFNSIPAPAVVRAEDVF